MAAHPAIGTSWTRLSSHALGPIDLERAQRRGGSCTARDCRGFDEVCNPRMDGKKRLSLWAACLQVGGYPELLLNLARQHGLEIHQQGRGRYVNRDDLDALARHVREWLDRPRMSRVAGLNSRTGPLRRNTVARVHEVLAQDDHDNE
jgi:hypothetical protein